MPEFRAKNDRHIDRLLADPHYRVEETGLVWTLRKRNGSIGTSWRVTGRRDKEGYWELYYKGKFLKIHRIVYRKFNGPLDETLVVDHGNRDTGDNRPGNLSLVTHQTNNEYRFRREDRIAVRSAA